MSQGRTGLIREGDFIRVTSGPLCGLNGRVVLVGERRRQYAVECSNTGRTIVVNATDCWRTT